MSNSKKIILDLCGGTGSWSKPYKDAGYDVRVITLPEWDVITQSFFDNRVWFSNGDWKMKEICLINDVYGILAAPPCTMFSTARTTAKSPRDLAVGMRTVEACIRVIWEIRKRKKLAFWALENPRGLLRQFLGQPAFTFQPNEFGELYTKHTDIWGYFNEPKKLRKPREIPDRVKMQLAKNNRILPQLPEGYSEPGRRNQAARRAMTSSKFAQAFFKANQ